jgi:Putative auto-transporter adhesin, head GIN domain
MKKQLIIITTFMLVVFIISTAFIVNIQDNRNPAVKDDYKVESFHSIAISIPGKVYIEQSSKNSLKINASEKTLEKIEVDVEDGKLIIKKKSGVKEIKDDIIIYITSPEYKGISIAGSSDIIAEKAIKSQELKIKIAGSGDLLFQDLTAGDLVTSISGSGDVKLKGNGGKSFEINIAGSGNIDSRNFPMDNVQISIAGSGECYVNAVEVLNARVAGSGDVYYVGKPSVQSSVAGSGKIFSL